MGMRVGDGGGRKEMVTRVVVRGLLHGDAAVRTAAASLVFNVAGYVQRGRVERIRGVSSGYEVEEDEDWEVEVVSAVVEAVDREVVSEEVGESLRFYFIFERKRR